MMKRSSPSRPVTCAPNVVIRRLFEMDRVCASAAQAIKTVALVSVAAPAVSAAQWKIAAPLTRTALSLGSTASKKRVKPAVAVLGVKPAAIAR
jgi:hypothetical protein